MKKFFLWIFCVVSMCAATVSVWAESGKTHANGGIYIDLSAMEMSEDGKKYDEIKEYEELAEFLEDYRAEKLADVYITDFLFDGAGEVLTPDLDDFLEVGEAAKIKTLEIKALNIQNTGTYELSGEAKGVMLAVNTNGLRGDVDIVLNNTKIDSDSKKAPALYAYNKDIDYTGCKVTISTAKGTKNYLEGGKLKKVSLVSKEKVGEYHDQFPGYYGIYSASEIEKVLFAEVQADNEGLSDGDPYFYYKASGAVSSDVDLYFEGEGYLKVTSKNKEGIESKGNLSLAGGAGDYEVIAQDDCLNTTTKSAAGKNVRNNLTIDVRSLVARVSDDGDEGDGIDSNGTLTINGGKIYAFSHSSSGDAGLDAENGIYINGGTVVATGNMADRIAGESQQKYMYLTFPQKIAAGTLVVVKNERDEIVVAFQTGKDISNLMYSDNEVEYETLKVYTGGEIKGEAMEGLYVSVESYRGGEEVEFSETGDEVKVQFGAKKNISSVLGIVLIVEIVALGVVIFVSRRR